MTTDYQNLKSFDVATIALMAVGVALVGFIIFTALPTKHQAHVEEAVAILDMHEQAQVPLQTVAFVFESADKFLQETYIAFAEVTTISIEFGKIADKIDQTYLAVADYAETLAMEYDRRNSSSFAVASSYGIVSGRSLEIPAEEKPVVKIQEREVVEELKIPYSYQPIEKDFFQNIINLKVESK